MNPRLLIAAAAAAAALLAGCTPGATANPTGLPPTPATTTSTAPTTSTPSATPTTSTTLDADQSAALKAAEAYWSALDKVMRSGKFDQYAIVKALQPTASDPVIQSNLNAARALWKKGLHIVGTKELRTKNVDPASSASQGVTQVTVTLCQDQDVAQANKKGVVVARPYPDHLRTTYDMRRGSGDFKVHEATTKEVGSC